jgi:hypothetical protein
VLCTFTWFFAFLLPGCCKGFIEQRRREEDARREVGI